MRVLQLNHVFDEVGGAEVYFRSLVRWQRDRGHEVGVFAGSQTIAVDDEDRVVVTRPEFDLSQIIDDAGLNTRFVEFAERFRPDVIHVHNLHSFPAGFVLAIASLGVPTIQTVHDLSLVCTNGWCVLPDGRLCSGGPGRKCLEEGCETNAPYDARIVQAAALRLQLLRSGFDAFLSPSEFVAERCRENGLADVHVIPYRVDPELLSERPAERATNHLLFAGRLAPEKGLRTLIEALPRVAEAHPDVKLSIVGRGPDEADLRALATRVGVDVNVTFPGRIPRAEVMDLLRTCTALVVPSHWCENSPVSCYESLLAGLPMIASDIGGIPELVRDGVTGLLVRPRDAGDLAEKLTQILGDGNLRVALGDGCRREVERYTDLGAHLDQIERVYAACAERDRAASRVTSDVDWTELIASMQRVNLRYTQLDEWATHGGRSRRVVGKVTAALFGAPDRPAGGAP